MGQVTKKEQNAKKNSVTSCKSSVSTHLSEAPGHWARMTSVKDRKRYLRDRVPGRLDLGHVASFQAHRGDTIPRKVISYRRVQLRTC